MSYFRERYGDPDWGKMKQPDYPALVADAIQRFPEATAETLLGLIMREQHGKTHPSVVGEEIKRQKEKA